MFDFYKILIFSGLILIFLGFLMGGKLGPLGKLPGDVLIEKESFKIYIPIATMILISIILNIILILFK